MSAYLRHAEMGHSDAECLEYVLAPWLLTKLPIRTAHYSGSVITIAIAINTLFIKVGPEL